MLVPDNVEIYMARGMLVAFELTNDELLDSELLHGVDGGGLVGL